MIQNYYNIRNDFELTSANDVCLPKFVQLFSLTPSWPTNECESGSYTLLILKLQLLIRYSCNEIVRVVVVVKYGTLH